MVEGVPGTGHSHHLASDIDLVSLRRRGNMRVLSVVRTNGVKWWPSWGLGRKLLSDSSRRSACCVKEEKLRLARER